MVDPIHSVSSQKNKIITNDKISEKDSQLSVRHVVNKNHQSTDEMKDTPVIQTKPIVKNEIEFNTFDTQCDLLSLGFEIINQDGLTAEFLKLVKKIDFNDAADIFESFGENLELITGNISRRQLQIDET